MEKGWRESPGAGLARWPSVHLRSGTTCLRSGLLSGEAGVLADVSPNPHGHRRATHLEHRRLLLRPAARHEGARGTQLPSWEAVHAPRGSGRPTPGGPKQDESPASMGDARREDSVLPGTRDAAARSHCHGQRSVTRPRRQRWKSSAPRLTGSQPPPQAPGAGPSTDCGGGGPEGVMTGERPAGAPTRLWVRRRGEVRGKHSGTSEGPS